MTKAASNPRSKRAGDGQPTIQITIDKRGDDTVIRLGGSLAGPLPPETRERVLALSLVERRLALDLSDVTEFSAAGLRKLLQFCRHVRAVGGTLSATGVSKELRSQVEAAGFGDLFRQAPAGAFASPRATIASRIDVYPTHFHGRFALRPGSPLPFGASVVAGGVNFAVFSRNATSCALVLFEPDTDDPWAEIPFLPGFRVGDVFCMTVFHLDPEEFEYGFCMDGPFAPQRGDRFDRSKFLLDPMARSVVRHNARGAATPPLDSPAYRGRMTPEDFDWEGDQPLGLPVEDLVIYEAHVRGFTRSPSSRVTFPGTFAGMREKIPYLKELGINCLELLPIFQFHEFDNDRVNPSTSERLCNYWGYSTVGFYAPHAGYAATAAMGTEADELKALVKDLHRHGIEILLDVVFNHTAEGDERGPTISFRGIDNRTYYMLAADGRYLNFSGCGNTFNCNHPVVRDFVLNSLRYWVSEYHIDGFRFDLASILGRAPDGSPLANPPLLEALAMDPVLAKTKLIAEAWDAGGLYQVGSFPAYGRWAEWNGRFRDCVRKALKSDEGQIAELAVRLVGSPDLYATRGPTASVNFVTCHDGFTLADLVSYNLKHNEANGENNCDGANDNHSWNCGTEGPTDDPTIFSLRRRQRKNALTMLFLSQGVPMLLMGDEVGRTQQGNNNAYCHDSPLNWLDWDLKAENADLFRFCRCLISFRLQHPVLHHHQHAGQTSGKSDRFEVTWHGTQVGCPDWSQHSRVLAFVLQKTAEDDVDAVYAALNFYWEELTFELPATPTGQRWHIVANTGCDAPNDIHEPGSEPPLDGTPQMALRGRSILVLVARPVSDASV